MTRTQIINAIAATECHALLEIYNQYKINDKFDQFLAQSISSGPNSQPGKMLLVKVKDILRKLDQTGSFDAEPPAHKIPPAEPKTSVITIQAPNPVKVVEPEKPAPTPSTPIEPITTKPLEFKKQIERPIIDSNPHVNRAGLPKFYQALYDENGQLNGEMKSKHAMLKVDQDPVRRIDLLKQLSDLEDCINRNWKKIDEWYESYKKEPAPQATGKEDPVKLSKKIDSSKKYLDRYYDHKGAKQIAKIAEAKEFLASLNIDYVPAPLRKKK